MPWVLVALGAATIAVAVWVVWLPREPPRVSARIEQMKSETTAPKTGTGGTTTASSTKKVLNVENASADLQKVDLFGDLNDDKKRKATQQSQSEQQQPAVPRSIQASPPSTTTTTSPTTTQGDEAKPAQASTGEGESESAGETAASPPTSQRSETVTVSLLFLGAVLVLGGAFYARVTSVELGPKGIKMSFKALRYIKEGVLQRVNELRAKGVEIKPADVVAILAAAERELAGAATIAGGPASVVAVARQVPGRQAPAIKVKGSKVVLAPDTLRQLGQDAVDSGLGNPDFE
jgi:hypothetical protein